LSERGGEESSEDCEGLHVVFAVNALLSLDRKTQSKLGRSSYRAAGRK
jgi:hypothetical protein